MLVRVLRHCVPLSLVALGVAEALILFGPIYLAVAFRFPAVLSPPERASQISPISPKALLFALVMLGALLALRLHQRESQQGDKGFHTFRTGAPCFA